MVKGPKKFCGIFFNCNLLINFENVAKKLLPNNACFGWARYGLEGQYCHQCNTIMRNSIMWVARGPT